MCAWAWFLNVSVRNLLHHDSRTGDRASPGHHHLRCPYRPLLFTPVRHNTPLYFPDYLLKLFLGSAIIGESRLVCQVKIDSMILLLNPGLCFLPTQSKSRSSLPAVQNLLHSPGNMGDHISRIKRLLASLAQTKRRSTHSKSRHPRV
jgi:hypothetical protein